MMLHILVPSEPSSSNPPWQYSSVQPPHSPPSVRYPAQWPLGSKRWPSGCQCHQLDPFLVLTINWYPAIVARFNPTQMVTFNSENTNYACIFQETYSGLISWHSEFCIIIIIILMIITVCSQGVESLKCSANLLVGVTPLGQSSAPSPWLRYTEVRLMRNTTDVSCEL